MRKVDEERQITHGLADRAYWETPREYSEQNGALISVSKGSLLNRTCQRARAKAGSPTGGYCNNPGEKSEYLDQGGGRCCEVCSSGYILRAGPRTISEAYMWDILIIKVGWKLHC